MPVKNDFRSRDPSLGSCGLGLAGALGQELLSSVNFLSRNTFPDIQKRLPYLMPGPVKPAIKVNHQNTCLRNRKKINRHPKLSYDVTCRGR